VLSFIQALMLKFQFFFCSCMLALFLSLSLSLSLSVFVRMLLPLFVGYKAAQIYAMAVCASGAVSIVSWIWTTLLYFMRIMANYNKNNKNKNYNNNNYSSTLIKRQSKMLVVSGFWVVSCPDHITSLTSLCWPQVVFLIFMLFTQNCARGHSR